MIHSQGSDCILYRLNSSDALGLLRQPAQTTSSENGMNGFKGRQQKFDRLYGGDNMIDKLRATTFSPWLTPGRTKVGFSRSCPRPHRTPARRGRLPARDAGRAAAAAGLAGSTPVRTPLR